MHLSRKVAPRVNGVNTGRMSILDTQRQESRALQRVRTTPFA